jgi:DNA-binding response OmpR family regulator
MASITGVLDRDLQTDFSWLEMGGKEWALTRILIAEDDPLIASFLEKGFRKRGFATCLVDDGEQAQSLGLSEDFDLIVLDFGLPRRDGFEVLRLLRSRGVDEPVIIVTGRRDIDAAACIAAGADGYLAKPFQFEHLLDHVQRLLHHRLEAS